MKRFEDNEFIPATPIARLQLGDIFDRGMSSKQRAKKNEEKNTTPSTLIVAGLFAGVGGLEKGFRQAGHKTVMLCECDPLARRVLARHFRDTELTSDVTSLKGLPDCDVLTAGFPCQDLSQVGRRQGITGPNSGLIGTVFKLLGQQNKLPEWIILENVPFMLVLDRGSAIREVTRALEELGYSWAYRTIDAKAFGLPQRRRRVILLASKNGDPRPALLGVDAGPPEKKMRGVHACGFYWTEGNTGLGWAVDSVPPLKGGSSLHIPSSPAIWFPKRRLIATLAIEDAERLQGFSAGWTDLSEEEPRSIGKRWRMVGNAVSVPMAKWIAKRLTAKTRAFDAGEIVRLPNDASWPSAGWGMNGVRVRSDVSEWPVCVEAQHLAGFLQYDLNPLSKKATSGFLSRLRESCLRYEESFERDLAYHAKMSASAKKSQSVAPETSKRMARTAQRDNARERSLRTELHRRGFRFRLHRKLIDGSRRSVDIIFPRSRIAVFVDGCFWHGCPKHGTWPKNNAEWWRAKIQANIERDRNTNSRLKKAGWTVVRVWEHENVVEAADRIARAVRARLLTS